MPAADTQLLAVAIDQFPTAGRGINSGSSAARLHASANRKWLNRCREQAESRLSHLGRLPERRSIADPGFRLGGGRTAVGHTRAARIARTKGSMPCAPVTVSFICTVVIALRV